MSTKSQFEVTVTMRAPKIENNGVQVRFAPNGKSPTASAVYSDLEEALAVARQLAADDNVNGVTVHETKLIFLA